MLLKPEVSVPVKIMRIFAPLSDHEKSNIHIVCMLLPGHYQRFRGEHTLLHGQSLFLQHREYRR